MTTDFILTISCPGKPVGRIGIENAVLDVLKSQRSLLHDCAYYRDPASGSLFMRLQFSAKDEIALRNPLAERAATLGFDWKIVALPLRPSVVLLTSRLGHCAKDLMERAATAELPMTVATLLSNHPEPADIAAEAGVPFQQLAVDRGDQEAAILAAVKTSGAELLILARYMQVLSPRLLATLPCPAINIHHSLLPAFVGRDPYGRAHAAGVRFIGATAHYVTAALDEGPIIEQDVRRISHRDEVQDLKVMGRDLERQVLARAVRLHLEHRVFRDAGRTVIL